MSRFICAALMSLMLVGCRVPGRHFGGEALQLRFARMASETIHREQTRESVSPPIELRRTAETEAVLLAGK